MPMSNQIDNFDVDACAEERHKTYITEGLGGDILGFKYQVWDPNPEGGPEDTGNRSWGHIFHLPFGVIMRDRAVEVGV